MIAVEFQPSLNIFHILILILKHYFTALTYSIKKGIEREAILGGFDLTHVYTYSMNQSLQDGHHMTN